MWSLLKILVVVISFAAVTGTAYADSGGDVLFEFELVGADGELVTANEFRGDYVLAGFGFTHCRHVCPTMAANMARVLQGGGNEVQGLFVSVDNERDTPQIVDSYAKGFSAKMVGVTGNYKQIAAAANNMRVSFAVTKSQDSFTVAHSSHLLLFDPEGKFVDSFAMNTDSSIILGAIKQHSRN